jgi:hypothetical protein
VAQKIGDIFIQVSQQMKAYSKYINTFNKAMVVLKESVNKDQRFKAFINVLSYSLIFCCITFDLVASLAPTYLPTPNLG